MLVAKRARGGVGFRGNSINGMIAVPVTMAMAMPMAPVVTMAMGLAVAVTMALVWRVVSRMA